MKLTLTMLLVLVGIGVFAYDISAQKRSISSEESLKLAYPNGYGQTNRVHRSVTIGERFSDGILKERSTHTYEFLGSNHFRQHTVVERGDVTDTTEIIRIGVLRYSRKNNEAWTTEDLTKEIISIGCGFGPFRVNQYTVEPTILNSVAVNLLESLSVWQDKDRLMYDENRKWVDEHGNSYKTEFESGTLSPRSFDHRSTSTTEYDPADLKIEAPIK
ncbi:MAG TPA: hypothetical protein PKA82_14920 [Pyrinomonadaceae bacterium]|nr:hypothetical protein [Pyrinomonadaceae bacterium]